MSTVTKCLKKERKAPAAACQKISPAYAEDIIHKERDADITLSPTSTNGDPLKSSDPEKVPTVSSKSDVNRPSTSSDPGVTVHFHDAELTQDIFLPCKLIRTRLMLNMHDILWFSRACAMPYGLDKS